MVGALPSGAEKISRATSPCSPKNASSIVNVNDFALLRNCRKERMDFSFFAWLTRP